MVGTSVAVLALVAGLGFSLSFAFDEAQQRREAESAGYRALLAASMAALDDQEHLVAQALLDQAPEALRAWEWHHAAARAEPLLWELPLDLSPPGRWEHRAPTVAFSPDGRLLAALVADDRVDVFVAETGARQHSIQLSGPMSINCLAATAAGFVTVTVHGHVAHWDGPTGELLQQQLAPELNVSGLTSPSLMAWDETSGRLAVFAYYARDGQSVSGESLHGKSLYLGPIGSLQLVDTGSTNHFPVAWTDDGQALVSYSHSLGAMVSDVVMDELGPATLRLRSRVAATRTYDGHGDRLLVVPEGGMTDKLVVVDLEGRELVRLDPQLQANVSHGAFSEDGRRIVTTTSGASRIVTVFDAASGRALTRWPSSGEALGALSPTGKLLAIGSPDRLIVLSLDSPATTVLPGANDYVYGLAWAPDGRTLWARNFDMSLRGYDVVEGAVVLDVPAPRGQFGNWDYQDK
ncbi:MAG: WD40 repeat protein, partial [Pseudohongiellaceae bacterium]